MSKPTNQGYHSIWGGGSGGSNVDLPVPGAENVGKVLTSTASQVLGPAILPVQSVTLIYDSVTEYYAGPCANLNTSLVHPGDTCVVILDGVTTISNILYEDDYYIIYANEDGSTWIEFNNSFQNLLLCSGYSTMEGEHTIAVFSVASEYVYSLESVSAGGVNILTKKSVGSPEPTIYLADSSGNTLSYSAAVALAPFVVYNDYGDGYVEIFYLAGVDDMAKTIDIYRYDAIDFPSVTLRAQRFTEIDDEMILTGS